MSWGNTLTQLHWCQINFFLQSNSGFITCLNYIANCVFLVVKENLCRLAKNPQTYCPEKEVN